MVNIFRGVFGKQYIIKTNERYGKDSLGIESVNGIERIGSIVRYGTE